MCRRVRWSRSASFSGTDAAAVVTVFDNVYLPMRLKGQRRKDAHDRVMEVLKLVHLDGFANNYPRQLSGA